MKDKLHISVCVCTFRRPGMLSALLSTLRHQETDGTFEYSIVVVDNDQDCSARTAVEDFTRESVVPVTYGIEPQQNIALARNRAVSQAQGVLVAFIDDDELAESDWLLRMYRALLEYDCDGVLGPVLPYFEVEPPPWVRKSGLFDRPNHETGSVLPWKFTRTGNALLRKSLFPEPSKAFNPDFVTGEDRDFFRRQIEKGNVFVWCREAAVYEVVPPSRWNTGFQIKRALMRGKFAVNNGSIGFHGLLKSGVAIAVYTVMLPFLYIFSRSLFMKYMVRDFDHIGKVLALIKIDLVGDKYIVE